MTLGLLKTYFSADYIEKTVKKILIELISSIDCEQVYLFGSAAENKLSDQSDIDFLVVITEYNQTFKNRKKALYSKFPISKHPLDIVWMSKAEFETKKKVGGIAMIAYEDGKLIYNKVEEAND